MIVQLEVQLNLLEDHCKRVFDEQKDQYLAEIATKLRVLLVRSKHNRPLLLDVMKELDISVNTTLDDGPSEWRKGGDTMAQRPGNRLSLDDFFDLNALTIQTSDGLVNMTKRDLIRAWSEQLGGAHEDWAVDEALLNGFNLRIRVFGVRPLVLELKNYARTTIQVGRLVLSRARQKMALANQSA